MEHGFNLVLIVLFIINIYEIFSRNISLFSDKKLYQKTMSVNDCLKLQECLEDIQGKCYV